MGKVSIRRRPDFERRDGQASLQCCLWLDGRYRRIPVGLTATKAEWDSKKERFRGRDKISTDKNLILSQFKAKVTDILVRFRLSGEKLTVTKLRTLLKSEPEGEDFIKYARQRVDELRSAMQWETYRHHIVTLEKLERFRPTLKFSEITPEFLRVYAAHLRNVHHNAPGTIAKNMSILKTHFLAALRNGKVKNNPFELYKMPQSYPSVVFLTEDELHRLVELYLSDTLADERQKTLRFFLFMCFTGMHISDARALRIEQIYGKHTVSHVLCSMTK